MMISESTTNCESPNQIKTIEKMPPATANDTVEHVYVTNTLIKSEMPIAICLSVLCVMILFFALYIFCCLAAMRGKLDITIYKKPTSPKLNLNFINPFKKKKEKDEDQIPFYRKVSSIDENQTDTDTC